MNTDFDRAGLQFFERGWLSSNNVLFPATESQGSTLVDSGYCSHAEQTLALVRANLRDGERLDRIVNTHLHSDHCGGNAALQQVFGCRIAVPAGDGQAVDAWDEAALTYTATGQSCPRFTRQGGIEPGSELQLGPFSWRVYGAPGHDPHSVVLHQPELALLISADALWENGFGVVFPEIEGDEAFSAVRSTLDQLSKLDVRWVIPGHGSPFCDISGALERAHRRLDAFVADPARHAMHAAKVLVKFHLLEYRSVSLVQLTDWMKTTPYMATIHQLYFRMESFRDWTARILAELQNARALRRDSLAIHDVSR